MGSLRHRALSVLCAATLATSMVPTQAFAETLTGGEFGANHTVTQEDYEVMDIETSSEMLDISTFSLDQSGQTALREGNYERWIDRLDVPEYALDFYAALEEAVDGDGTQDYLIADKYFSGNVVNDNRFSVVGGNRCLKVCEQQCTSFADKDVKSSEANQYALAVMAAFDRDHPEVFWLSNRTVVTGSYLHNSQTGAGTLTTYLVLQGEVQINGVNTVVDIRADDYMKKGAIREGVALRDEKTNAILDLLPENWDKVDAINHFNRWLTYNNEYNTIVTANGQGYKEAYECTSALDGREGDRGPVCEGYARAFKVLCDAVEIPCVLVDGDASGPHMWNYAQVDGRWYGVDVTWNDPTNGSGKKSGFEHADWLLVGALTETGSKGTFERSHPVSNKVSKETPACPNGPSLTSEKYENNADADCAKGNHTQTKFSFNNNATCTKDGTETKYCVYCGEAETRTVSNSALGHALGAYVYNNDAKVGVDGTETATCLRCGAKDTRTKAGSALKADTSNSGTTQPSGPTTKPSTPTAKPTAPSTSITKPSTSAGSSTTTATPVPAAGRTVVAGAAFCKVTGAATVTYAGPSNKKAASVTVPATVAISGRTYKVTAIAPKAFAGNKYLKSVKIGANVTAIPASAFKGCTKLTSVSFGNGITSLGKNAFYGCKALKSVTLGTKVATIGDGAFQNCTKLTKVTVKSKSLKSVGKNAFAGCKKLKAITLKTTKLKSVGKNALKGTAKKLTVKVPKAKVRAYQKLFKSKGSKAVVVKK
ncbi:leucine-rich repeat protein [Eggerthellaceae bacterium 24-137]